MLDIRLIREQTDFVKQGLTKVGVDPALVDRALGYDEERRRLETNAGELRNRRNVGSKMIGAMKEPHEREKQMAEMRIVGDQISEIDAQLARVNADQQALMLTIP